MTGTIQPKASKTTTPSPPKPGSGAPDQFLLDTDIRVIDQRIGQGIGGTDTVIRAYHRPTGILVEVPRVGPSQLYDREIALDMLRSAITHPQFRGN